MWSPDMTAQEEECAGKSTGTLDGDGDGDDEDGEGGRVEG